MSAYAVTLACPLAAAPQHQRLTVDRISGDAATRERLSALGLIAGVEMEILNRLHSGAILIAVRESRLVLGPDMARRLWVR